MVKKTGEEENKFENFLREHRPPAPPAQAEECDSIWQVVKREGGYPRFIDVKTLGLALACLLVALLVVVQRGRDSSSNERREILLVKESMNLNFMDGEEINEVVDLVSIGH